MRDSPGGPLLLGIDLGTSSVKTALVDHAGRTLSTASRLFETSSPSLGWAEQDPLAWWTQTCLAVHDLIHRTGIDAESVYGICVSGQMHGLVLLGASGEILRRAIIWSDARTKDECRRIESALGVDRIIRIAGNRASTGYASTSFLWVRQHEPRVAASARTLLMPKDFVRMRLTGEVCTDFSDASGSLLLDIRKRQWSPELSSAAGVDMGLLPEVRESEAVVGELVDEAGEALDLKRGTPVIAGGGDSMVGALGCGVIRNGTASVNIGTGGQAFAPTSDLLVDADGRTNTFCHAVAKTWAVQGSILSAGLSLRWIRDTLGQEELEASQLSHADVYDVLCAEAASAPPGCEGLIFLPYLVGERTPHNDPDARGVLFGLNLRHGKAHVIRAVLEGVSFALKDCLLIMRGLGMDVRTLIMRGGGSKSALWREILANVLEAETVISSQANDVCFGACLLAGVGAGVWNDLGQACEQTVRFGEASVPAAEIASRYREQHALYDSLYHSLRHAFQAAQT